MPTHIDTLAELHRPKSRRRVRKLLGFPKIQHLGLPHAQFAQEKADLRERSHPKRAKA